MKHQESYTNLNSFHVMLKCGKKMVKQLLDRVEKDYDFIFSPEYLL